MEYTRALPSGVIQTLFEYINDKTKKELIDSNVLDNDKVASAILCISIHPWDFDIGRKMLSLSSAPRELRIYNTRESERCDLQLSDEDIAKLQNVQLLTCSCGDEMDMSDVLGGFSSTIATSPRLKLTDMHNLETVEIEDFLLNSNVDVMSFQKLRHMIIGTWSIPPKRSEFDRMPVLEAPALETYDGPPFRCSENAVFHKLNTLKLQGVYDSKEYYLDSWPLSSSHVCRFPVLRKASIWCVSNCLRLVLALRGCKLLENLEADIDPSLEYILPTLPGLRSMRLITTKAAAKVKCLSHESVASLELTVKPRHRVPAMHFPSASRLEINFHSAVITVDVASMTNLSKIITPSTSFLKFSGSTSFLAAIAKYSLSNILSLSILPLRDRDQSLNLSSFKGLQTLKVDLLGHISLSTLTLPDVEGISLVIQSHSHMLKDIKLPLIVNAHNIGNIAIHVLKSPRTEVRKLITEIREWSRRGEHRCIESLTLLNGDYSEFLRLN